MKKNTKKSIHIPGWSVITSAFLIAGTILYSHHDTSNQASGNLKQDSYSVCFTPNKKCQSLILSKLSQAQKSIYIQAYSFTDPDIGNEILKARHRGVKLNIILDKSNKKDKRSIARLLEKKGIPYSIDPIQGIAHNKIIIIDEKILITGSYNFSKSAYKRNTENLLIIENESLAKTYLENWSKRWNISERN